MDIINSFDIEERERLGTKDLKKYYPMEIARVEKALEDATKRVRDLQQTRILTGAKVAKISELKGAIAIGKLYLNKLKRKVY